MQLSEIIVVLFLLGLIGYFFWKYVIIGLIIFFVLAMAMPVSEEKNKNSKNDE